MLVCLFSQTFDVYSVVRIIRCTSGDKAIVIPTLFPVMACIIDYSIKNIKYNKKLYQKMYATANNLLRI